MTGRHFLGLFLLLPAVLRHSLARAAVVEERTELLQKLADHAPNDTRQARAASVRSRKPPWYSYDDVITRSASRAARFEIAASASGVPSSPSIPAMPSPESGKESAPQRSQTAPPARGE